MDDRNKQILRLAIPSIVSNVTVPLIGLVDLAISGHLGRVAYIGAIAVGSMIFNIFYWLFGFLRMGTSGMTSQALGRRDLADSTRQLVRSLGVAMAIAAFFLILQWPLGKLALWAIGPSADVRPLVITYYNIVIWGAPAMLCQYALTGWFIGMQNTRAPMAVAIFQNVVNIMVSAFFALGCGMKLEGVALGTLVAQWGGLALAALVWWRGYRRLLRYDWRTGLFTPTAMRHFFTVNRDIFLRTLCLVSVNLFFVSAGARQGDIVLSINTLLMTMFTIFSYFMDGFAYAAEALSGKCYGAGNSVAFHDTVHRLMRWGTMMALVFTAVYALGGDAFLSLLTDQAAVVSASHDYFLWALVIPAAGMAAFVYDGIFIGMTATRGMLLSCAVGTVAFFALFLLLSPSLHNHALWLAFVVYLALRGAVEWGILSKSQNRCVR